MIRATSRAIGTSEPFGAALRRLVVRASWTGAVALVAAPASAQCWAEVAKIRADAPEVYDRFGESVSVSGDTLVAGSQHGDGVVVDSGCAYVFDRTSVGGVVWNRTKKLVASDGRAGDAFFRVSISGDTVVVGAPRGDGAVADCGAAYVYDRNQGGPDIWGRTAKLLAFDGLAGDQFGVQVSVSGDTIVVGARAHAEGGASTGAAYVFERNAGGANHWGPSVKLLASDGSEGDWFGWAVSISGDTLVVGANLDDDNGFNSGSAYVFDRHAGGTNNWGQVAKLVASDGAASDFFGGSVSISGDTVVLGAYGDQDFGYASGAAYVFERDHGGPDNWGEVVKLLPSPGAAFGGFGGSVSASVDRIVVGQGGIHTGTGDSYLFERDHGGVGAWGEVLKLAATDGSHNDFFGNSVACSGHTLVVGAYADNEGGTSGDWSGSVYVFESNSPHCPVGYCTAGTSGHGCSATIATRGIPSASAPVGFELVARSVEAPSVGIFLFGANGRSATPWGNGTSYRCVAPPASRAVLLPSFGTAAPCTGVLVLDLHARWTVNPLQNPGAGAVVQAQLWYRDPSNPSDRPTSFSDAVEFTVGL